MSDVPSDVARSAEAQLVTPRSPEDLDTSLFGVLVRNLDNVNNDEEAKEDGSVYETSSEEESDGEDDENAKLNDRESGEEDIEETEKDGESDEGGSGDKSVGSDDEFVDSLESWEPMGDRDDNDVDESAVALHRLDSEELPETLNALKEKGQVTYKGATAQMPNQFLERLNAKVDGDLRGVATMMTLLVAANRTGITDNVCYLQREDLDEKGLHTVDERVEIPPLEVRAAWREDEKGTLLNVVLYSVIAGTDVAVDLYEAIVHEGWCPVAAYVCPRDEIIPKANGKLRLMEDRKVTLPCGQVDVEMDLTVGFMTSKARERGVPIAHEWPIWAYVGDVKPRVHRTALTAIGHATLNAMGHKYTFRSNERYSLEVDIETLPDHWPRGRSPGDCSLQEVRDYQKSVKVDNDEEMQAVGQEDGSVEIAEVVERFRKTHPAASMSKGALTLKAKEKAQTQLPKKKAENNSADGDEDRGNSAENAIVVSDHGKRKSKRPVLDVSEEEESPRRTKVKDLLSGTPSHRMKGSSFVYRNKGKRHSRADAVAAMEEEVKDKDLREETRVYIYELFHAVANSAGKNDAFANNNLLRRIIGRLETAHEHFKLTGENNHHSLPSKAAVLALRFCNPTKKAGLNEQVSAHLAAMSRLDLAQVGVMPEPNTLGGNHTFTALEKYFDDMNAGIAGRVATLENTVKDVASTATQKQFDSLAKRVSRVENEKLDVKEYDDQADRLTKDLSNAFKGKASNEVVKKLEGLVNTLSGKLTVQAQTLQSALATVKGLELKVEKLEKGSAAQKEAEGSGASRTDATPRPAKLDTPKRASTRASRAVTTPQRGDLDDPGSVDTLKRGLGLRTGTADNKRHRAQRDVRNDAPEPVSQPKVDLVTDEEEERRPKKRARGFGSFLLD